MPHIFISYRRDDSGYVAGMLCRRLQETFGPTSVFIDVDTIPLGVDFRQHLTQAVAKCDLFLAIIGDSWIGHSPGKLGRLHDPADLVRIEIEAALERGVTIVPVLVGHAYMPSAEDLPDSLRPLVFRNAAELRSGKDMHHHTEALIRGLSSLVGGTGSLPYEDPGPANPKDPAPTRASLTVKRLARVTLALWRVAIYVNGELIDKVSVGSSATLSLEPGPVSLMFEIAGRKADCELMLTPGAKRSLVIEVSDSGELRVECSNKDVRSAPKNPDP